MAHEYEELIEDEHSKHGHLDLIFRQGKEVGLERRGYFRCRAAADDEVGGLRVVLDCAYSLAGVGCGLDYRRVDQ